MKKLELEIKIVEKWLENAKKDAEDFKEINSERLYHYSRGNANAFELVLELLKGE